jgi:endogenous inhibitor of DNA gyrase (YacG/DUF329 family)
MSRAKKGRDEAGGSAQATGGKCPICGKPTVHAVRPFCSARCADIDLGRWVSGAYVIRGAEDGDEDGDRDLAQDARAPGLPGADEDDQ